MTMPVTNLAACDPAQLQLGLLRSYVVILERTRQLPRIIWLPVFTSKVLCFVRVPVLRAAVSILVHRHIRRIIDALLKAYQLRRAAAEDPGSLSRWTELRRRAKAMKSAVPDQKVQKAVLALLAFIVVALASRVLPRDEVSLFAEMIGAVVTIKPEKFAELAAKPEAVKTVLAVGAWLLLLFIASTPIVIYHFRFKRALFNYRPLPSSADLQAQTITRVWKETATREDGIYDIENHLFQSLDDSPRHEIPIDYNALTIVYGYYAAGPGATVLALGLWVFSSSSSAGWTWIGVGVFNLLIGVDSILRFRRSALARKGIASKISG